MIKISETSLNERIKNLAKEKGTSINELLKKLYLERFLARLAESEYIDKLIFKGVEPFIPAQEKAENHKTRGRSWVEQRKILEGTLWVFKTGARWKDLPADDPAYQTCHRRFQQWVELGIFNEILRA